MVDSDLLRVAASGQHLPAVTVATLFKNREQKFLKAKSILETQPAPAPADLNYGRRSSSSHSFGEREQVLLVALRGEM